jgi:hypothetical protein
MAEKGSLGGADWTAGIVAIAAALLLGSAIPIGLYFGLYKPKVAELVTANQKLTQIKVDMNAMVARSEKVTKLETEGDAMAKRVTEIEAPFAVSDPERLDVPDAWAAIQKLADDHYLELRPERKTQLGARVVYKSGNRIQFQDGLYATKLTVEAQAFFHDFARFLSKLEHMQNFVVIPESMTCIGDANGGTTHTFVLEIYVVERRDVDLIGR